MDSPEWQQLLFCKKKLPLSKNHNRGAQIFISTPKFSGKYVCCP
jgi:hypothetical protein